MNHVTKATETIVNTFKIVREKRTDHLDNSISNGKCQKLVDESPSPEEQRKLFASFNEYKFLICLICFSSTIVFCKIPIAYKDVFRRAFASGKSGWSKPLNFVNYDFISFPTAAFTAIWSVFVELRWLFVPAIVGIATSLITWHIIFMNSRIPGVDPPIPSYRRPETLFQNSNTSNYRFALSMGILVFIALLVNEFLSL